MSIEHKELPDELSMYKAEIEIEIFKSKPQTKNIIISSPQTT